MTTDAEITEVYFDMQAQIAAAVAAYEAMIVAWMRNMGGAQILALADAIERGQPLEDLPHE